MPTASDKPYNNHAFRESSFTPSDHGILTLENEVRRIEQVPHTTDTMVVTMLESVNQILADLTRLRETIAEPYDNNEVNLLKSIVLETENLEYSASSDLHFSVSVQGYYNDDVYLMSVGLSNLIFGHLEWRRDWEPSTWLAESAAIAAHLRALADRIDAASLASGARP